MISAALPGLFLVSVFVVSLASVVNNEDIKKDVHLVKKRNPFFDFFSIYGVAAALVACSILLKIDALYFLVSFAVSIAVANVLIQNPLISKKLLENCTLLKGISLVLSIILITVMIAFS